MKTTAWAENDCKKTKGNKLAGHGFRLDDRPCFDKQQEEEEREEEEEEGRVGGREHKMCKKRVG
jgi:hypothetical protein